nr:MAG TPA: hypothetical protein [Caudoviricetes sp.]
MWLNSCVAVGAGSGQNDCGTRVAPWLNLTFPNLF